MTKEEEIRDAIALLRRHNAWRRSDNITTMENPTKLGIAIECVCDAADARGDREMGKSNERLTMETISKDEELRAKDTLIENLRTQLAKALEQVANLTLAMDHMKTK